jgi:hypothetical protein
MCCPFTICGLYKEQATAVSRLWLGATAGPAAANGRTPAAAGSLPFDPQLAELFQRQLSFDVAHGTDRCVN